MTRRGAPARAPPRYDDPMPRAHRPPSAAPRLTLSGARAAYVGPGLTLDPHTNAVATVAIALEAPFTLRVEDTPRPLRAPPADAGRPLGEPTQAWIALIPPDTHHHLVSVGSMVFIYLDAASDDHRLLRGATLDARAEALRRAATGSTAQVDALCAALGIPTRSPIDARVRAVIDRLETHPDDARPLEAWASQVGLSASRLQALFRAELGLAFRRYRTWRRMAAVVRILGQGRTLTEAAHEAGFGTSAHLSSTFRSMFGLPPSRLTQLGLRVEDTRQAGTEPAGQRGLD